MLLKNIFHRLDSLLSLFFLGLIKLYKLVLSPYLGNNCRYTPTCSTYAYESIKKFGAIKGSYLGIKRILRCNPLFKGGLDLIPEQKSENNNITNK